MRHITPPHPSIAGPRRYTLLPFTDEREWVVVAVVVEAARVRASGGGGGEGDTKFRRIRKMQPCTASRTTLTVVAAGWMNERPTTQAAKNLVMRLYLVTRDYT